MNCGLDIFCGINGFIGAPPSKLYGLNPPVVPVYPDYPVFIAEGLLCGF